MTSHYSATHLQPSALVIGQGVRIIEKFYGKLYEEGDKLDQLFFLIEGKVALYKKNAQGRKIKLPPVKNGAFLGLQGHSHFNVSSHTARVCKPSKLLIIPFAYIPEFVKRWPTLKDHIVCQLIGRLDMLSSY